MDINGIIEKLKNESLAPHELAEMRSWLGGEYAYLTGQLISVLKDKPSEWEKIRYGGEVKSDTAAERLWQKTEKGQGEMILRLQLRSIERLMSGIKSRLDVLIGESRNQY